MGIPVYPQHSLCAPLWAQKAMLLVLERVSVVQKKKALTQGKDRLQQSSDQAMAAPLDQKNKKLDQVVCNVQERGSGPGSMKRGLQREKGRRKPSTDVEGTILLARGRGGDGWEV